MTVIVCHLSGPFSVVFLKKKTNNYGHVTYFTRFNWSHNFKVIAIGKASDFMQIRFEPCANYEATAPPMIQISKILRVDNGQISFNLVRKTFAT